ncbi:MAG: bifunctional riboflavin kinase/FAD synthetase [Christensenella sp.]
MKLITQKDLPLKEPTAVAIGLFDGIHKGHSALINDIKQYKDELKSLVYTFDTKPNHAAYKNIYTAQEKFSIFSSMQIDAFYMQPFTAEFSQLTKEEFLRRITDDFNAKHITVGFDFRFGKNAEGTAQYLEQQAEKHGYTVRVVPEVLCNEGKISSTLIRTHIERGEMQSTAELLGRFYFIDGIIEKGNSIGAAIGFPTANISTDKLMPKYGVYATFVEIGGKRYSAVTNVGVKPTITDDGTPNIETFIFDFSDDVYDAAMRVNFVSFLRAERTFQNVDALKAQIARDAIDARTLLEKL